VQVIAANAAKRDAEALKEEKLYIKCAKLEIYCISKRVVANAVIISYVTSNY